MSRKSKIDIDYEVFHKTGVKVSKNRKIVKMDLNEKKLQELKIISDIEEFFVNSEFDDTSEELNDSLEEITKLSKEYRHIHVELKSLMGTNYDTDYPQYPGMSDKMRKFIRDNKGKVKNLKQGDKNTEVEKSRSSLKIEELVFRERLEREIKIFDVESIEETSDVKEGCYKFDHLLEEYYKLLGRAKIVFGSDYETEFKDIFEGTFAQINGVLQQGKAKIKNLNVLRDKTVLDEKIRHEKEVHDNFICEQKFQADILAKEIEARCVALCKKCDISLLTDMSDYQILEISKNMSSIDCEMREILDKITSFSKIAALCGSEKEKMLVEPLKQKDKALKGRNEYAIKLHSIFQDRDISEEKLKNASGLNIELAKFKGYESKLDVYSFQSEFEKLVQPTIQKRYWVDALKKNYLSGPALVLVDRIEDISEVWSKLIGAYGDVKLLLQNKISSLDNLENLDKIKGDEKLGNAIAKIINMMTELSTLAQKHNLECKLYIGGGLEKIFSLIGQERERKFLSKTLDEKPKVDSGKTSTAGQSQGSSEVFTERLTWKSLKSFLQKELTLREKLTLMQKSKNCLGINTSGKGKPGSGQGAHAGAHGGATQVYLCHICGRNDHVLSSDRNGGKHVDYFSCKSFVEMSPKQRFNELKQKGFCLQCLTPGMKYDENHTCHKKYTCPDSYHQKYPKGLHVLICEGHKKKKSNTDLLEEYKRNFINKRSSDFENFTKNISLICQNNSFAHSTFNLEKEMVLPDVKDSAIFMLQTINVGGCNFNLFYDTGCSDVVVKKSAIDKLLNLGRAKHEVEGPITLSGVGNHKSVCDHGVYSFCLPLRNGYDAMLSGLCLDQVTAEFPKYALQEVEKDVRKLCKKQGGNALLKTLPKLSSEVGGETDILIGIQYLKYHPRKIWVSPTGLSMSESCFLSADETTGVIGGPHGVFTEIHRKHQSTQTNEHNLNSTSNLNIPSYFTCSVNLHRNRFRSSMEVTLLGEKSRSYIDGIGSEETLSGSIQIEEIDSSPSNRKALVVKKPPKCMHRFEEVESAGTEVTYRCVTCRGCQDCKKSQRIDVISIQEEIEQDLIDRCVDVDIEHGVTTAKLPFLTNPDTKLMPNERIALRIYESQIRILDSKPEDKKAVILSEGKLQDLGFVDYFSNLSKEDQSMIIAAAAKYFIPWRVVWNLNSLSTPCRMVLDASFSARGGCSLNSLLAKGTNNMNNLIIILIRWTMWLYVFHTDIAKMYNALRLFKAHWRYQLYLWDEELRVGVQPVWKVIKTVIYGVRPSGNLAERGIRRTAELTRAEYPKAYDVIMNDVYVDDCLSGNNSIEDRNSTTDQLSTALAKGGFSLKGFTFSGEDPPEHLSNDRKTVTVGGLKWYSKADEVSLNIPELNFSKKSRGRKSLNEIGKIPVKLTKRACVSKVAEIFDPTGRVTPLTSGFKIDINQLTLRKLDWDDEIPDDFRQIWVSNFEMIQEVGNIRYKRAVIPVDAIDHNVETICMGDASQVMVCVGIYARFKRKNGQYSCQLVFGRSKVVPQMMSMPRAELLAASLNASTAHVVNTSLGDRVKKSWMCTDSQVVLHWIGCSKFKLKLWSRNKVIEINRLVDLQTWRYVESRHMVADIGTRKGAKVIDVGPDGVWSIGQDWMRGDEADFPVKTAIEIVLDNESKREAKKEEIVIELDQNYHYLLSHLYMPSQSVPDEVGLRYKYSDYLIDPNRFRFRKVVRVLALVFLFLKNLCAKIKERVINPCFIDTSNSPLDMPDILAYQMDRYIVTVGKKSDNSLQCKAGFVVDLPEALIKDGLRYFFKKATEEIKHFLRYSKYENISQEINEVLYYTGRILPDQEIGGNLTLCDTSFDLSNKTFCVPLVDKLSPIAYAIANEVHWYHPDVKHGGIESVLRHVQCITFIIEGRKLIKDIKKACIRCRLLKKQAIRAAMGPKHDANLCIAPAFHSTQVDICGPFDSFSNANKRAKLKIWLVVFCCCATGSVDCKVMEDYSTDAFILAFIRFSCRYGYPRNLLPDYGSQLIKGCKNMILSFSDLQHKLSVEFGVSFETCPVGAHYVHGKVERKIQQIKKSIEKEISNRLSIIQWETLSQQISNSINNLPIGLGNKTEDLENLDLLTPNRLLLGRNNTRSPTAPLVLSNDVKRIVETNSDIFKIWFKSWLISYVPTLIDKPKWFENDRNISVGDVVLFLKSEKEFENVYQYGLVKSVVLSKDDRVRTAEIEYKNYNENVKRTTKRGVRDLVVIHPVEEIGMNKELHNLVMSNEE